MRKIDLIVLHCTANFPGQDISIEDITAMHRQLGWKTCGYHYLIRLDGTVEKGRPLEEAGAHCKKHNANSIGIAYVGGLDKTGNPTDTRTDAQKEALVNLIQELKEQFPDVDIKGHNEFVNKACPCFDVQEWRKEVLL